jgi:hypothetical protein
MIGVSGRPRWSAAELRDVRPDVLEAARWELFAERIWPGSEVEASLNAPDKPTEAYLRRERLAGRTALRAIRARLLPADEAP